MNRTLNLMIAGLAGCAVAAAASPVMSATTASAPLVRTTGYVLDEAVPAISVACTSRTTAVAALSAHRTPNKAYYWATYVNGVRTRSGLARTSSGGTFTAHTSSLAVLRKSGVTLKLNNVTATTGAVTPRCPAPAAISSTSSAPRGSAASFSVHHNANGTITRWNPCDGDITVMVNPGTAGASAVADVQSALAQLSSSSGLHFVYSGTTSFVPNAVNGALQPAKIVIAWAGRTKTDLLGAGAIGEGGWRSRGTSLDGATWIWKISQGFVIVDPAASAAPGFGRGISRGSLLLHELGHAAGLGHVNDASQVMNPVLSSTSYASYGSGDKAGLAAVGAPHGCVTAA